MNQSATQLFEKSLDTLAHLQRSGTPNPEQDLLKKAKRKSITVHLAGKLIALQNSNVKAYRNMYYCNQVLSQDGQELKTSYCKNRLCMVCNSIKTANLINGYVPELQKMTDPHFMTLTIKAVRGKELRPAINQMQKDLRSIVQQLSRRSKQKGIIKPLKIVAIRKLECNFNPKTYTYNPHFHLIIDGLYEAAHVLNLWLNYNPRSNLKGQDITPADLGSMKELFKYATKIVAKDGNLYPRAIDRIYSAFHNKRTVQPIGIKKFVDEDEREKTIYPQLTDERAQWSWNDANYDWVNEETGEFLTGFSPGYDIKLLFEELKE